MHNKPTDFNDLHIREGVEKVYETISHALQSKKLTSININEFLSLSISEREMILSPVIPAQGLVMLYGARGGGKTFCSITIAVTVASGGQMLNGKWKAPKPIRVLYIDGEMPSSVLQERIANIVAAYDFEIPDPNNLHIITPDEQDIPIPDLSTAEGQKMIEQHIEGVSLLILDNLSALCRTGKENESESWVPMQGWLLSLRKRGISVLLIHHAGKNDKQRGNSKKEDLLDTVIALKKPKDYDPEDGARFEVHYEKARGFYGNDAKPFEAKLIQKEDALIWQVIEIEDHQLNQVIELTHAGSTQRDIAKELEISATTVNRMLKKAKERGLIQK